MNSQSSSYLPFDSSRPLPFCSKASENDENGDADVKSEAFHYGTPSPKTPSAKVSRGRASIKGIMRKRKSEAANSNYQEKRLSISLVDANKAGELISDAASSLTSAKAAASRASASAATSSTSSAATSNTSTVLPVDTQKFLAFAETHRTVLNQILRQSTVHLADGPFSVLVDHTRVLDFDIKRR